MLNPNRATWRAAAGTGALDALLVVPLPMWGRRRRHLAANRAPDGTGAAVTRP